MRCASTSRIQVELPFPSDRRPLAAVLAANVVSITGNALTHMGVPWFVPILATVMYETVPEELRSRVLSATTASVLTITPLGGLAAGFLADSAGLFTTMLVVGGLYLLATLSPVVFPAWRQMDGPARLSDSPRKRLRLPPRWSARRT